jgi:hypothetical protein
MPLSFATSISSQDGSSRLLATNSFNTGDAGEPPEWMVPFEPLAGTLVEQLTVPDDFDQAIRICRLDELP